ncbi:hypothetical protein FOZ63_029272 [Perkinsus olseni]|uniref:Uncharacterized protein n=1 Tax=Perkinsus olseni TaxID=32597 RepID=A0A7J6TGT8_PEROL|nr:hypothetical protein FOZ63_029272 [Perkinsus olseni]
MGLWRISRGIHRKRYDLCISTGWIRQGSTGRMGTAFYSKGQVTGESSLSLWGALRSRDPPPSSHDLPRPKRASRGTLDGFAILEATGAAKLPEDVMSVSLASRQLKSVATKDLVYFRNLDTLDVSDNRLSSSEMLLKLGNLRRLRVLSLSCNSLATLYTEFPRPDRRSSEIPRGESLLPNLEELDLSFNDLREDTFLNVSLTVFTRLIKLNMAHNCVASIPVHLAASPNDFPFLTDLNLSHNDLVQYDQWNPLEGLPRLESLSLAHNRIRRVEPIDGVTEEARNKRTKDVFRSLKWLDLSGNELRDSVTFPPQLPRLHEHLSMLIGACDKTVVVKGNPLAEHPDFPEMAERLRPRSRSGKITFTARGPQAGVARRSARLFILTRGILGRVERSQTPPSQRKKPIRVFEDVPLRTIDARHGFHLARQARGRAEEQEQGILRRTEGLLNPELGEEDVALLMQARKRQIDDFVRDFEASLSRMGPDTYLAAAPFPLSESTQDTLTELAARMGGGLDDDLGKPVVKEAGALNAKNHGPIVEVPGSSSGANAVVAVGPDGSQLDARAAIVKRRSWKPLARKAREPTASDVAGTEEAMRLLREAESKCGDSMLCDR